jgi:hypothetical protein
VFESFYFSYVALLASWRLCIERPRRVEVFMLGWAEEDLAIRCTGGPGELSLWHSDDLETALVMY